MELSFLFVINGPESEMREIQPSDQTLLAIRQYMVKNESRLGHFYQLNDRDELESIPVDYYDRPYCSNCQLFYQIDPELDNRFCNLSNAIETDDYFDQLKEAIPWIRSERLLNLEYNGYTLLCDSVLTNDVQIVKYLIDQGVDVNQSTELCSPLTEAIMNNNLEIVQLLVDNINRPDRVSLFHALDSDRYEIFKYLLDFVTDIDIVDHHGDNLVIALVNHYNIEALQLTIQRGCNLDFINRSGNTALMIAVREDLRSIVELLLDNGADLDIPNRNGQTASDIAIEIGHQELAAVMVRYTIPIKEPE